MLHGPDNKHLSYKGSCQRNFVGGQGTTINFDGRGGESLYTNLLGGGGALGQRAANLLKNLFKIGSDLLQNRVHFRGKCI